MRKETPYKKNEIVIYNPTKEKVCILDSTWEDYLDGYKYLVRFVYNNTVKIVYNKDLIKEKK